MYGKKFLIVLAVFIVIVMLGAGIRIAIPQNSNYNYLNVTVDSKGTFYNETISNCTVKLDLNVSFTGNKFPYNISFEINRAIYLVYLGSYSKTTNLSIYEKRMTGITNISQVNKTDIISSTPSGAFAFLLNKNTTMLTNNMRSHTFCYFGINGVLNHPSSGFRIYDGVYGVVLGELTSNSTRRVVLSRITYVNRVIVIQ